MPFYFVYRIFSLLVHQEILEGSEVFRHFDALLLALHKLGEASWYLDVCAKDTIHLLLELGRMSGLQEYTYLAWLQLLLQGTITASSVRVKHILRVIVALLHRIGNLLIAVSGTTDIGCDGIVVALVEVLDAGKV